MCYDDKVYSTKLLTFCPDLKFMPIQNIKLSGSILGSANPSDLVPKKVLCHFIYSYWPLSVQIYLQMATKNVPLSCKYYKCWDFYVNKCLNWINVSL